MGISPTRAEARLTKSKTALGIINTTYDKIKSLLEDQDQRQVSVTLLENQITALKDTLIPEKVDAPPNEENASILDQITSLEQGREQIASLYGEASNLLNKLNNDAKALHAANPYLNESTLAQQEAALARKQAAYPRLLLRHLRKCKAHGWTDARMAKLAEHKTNLRAERKALEPTEPTPTEQLAESLRG